MGVVRKKRLVLASKDSVMELFDKEYIERSQCPKCKKIVTGHMNKITLKQEKQCYECHSAEVLAERYRYGIN